MSRDKNGVKGKQEIREEAQKRLRWLMLEAKEEELDSREVEALVHLLTVLDEEKGREEAQPDAEAAYRRFLQYKEEREEDERRLNAAADEIHADAVWPEPARKRGRGHKRGKARYVSVAAAAAAAVLLLVGTGVGANARKDSGFFHWLKKDETGVTLITSPENLTTETSMEGTLIYTDPEEVPEKYKQYVVTEADIQALEGFELQRVEILDMKKGVKEMIFFSKEDKDKILTVGSILYSNEITYNRENYSNYKHLYTIEENIPLDVYCKKDSEGTEYIICFYYGQAQYFVQGEYEIEFMEELSKQYQQCVISQ